MSYKLFSWNVNGIRAGIKKGMWPKVLELDADIIAMQETKSDAQIMSSQDIGHPDYDLKFHSCSMKKGYSGVATFTKYNNGLQLIDSKVGLDIPDFDVEGRLVQNFYTTASGKKFVLLNGYFPQGGRGPHRIEYKIEFYRQVHLLTKELRKQGFAVIICGDLNTTVGDIDLARPNENRKTTGCLPEEREALNWFLNDGFVDSFRYFYPDTPGRYSYWDQITRARERNVGWRIDYFLVDQELLPFLKSANIHDQVMGSDHCPVSIEIDL